MRKLLTLIVIFFIQIGINSYSFNFESYKESTLLEIAKFATHDSGLSFFSSKYKINIIIDKYPEKITKDGISKRNTYKAGSKTSQEMLDLYNYQFFKEQDGFKFLFLVQNPLVWPMNQEIKLGDNADLYVLLTMYNEFDKTIILFVNEFKALKKKEFIKNKKENIMSKKNEFGGQTIEIINLEGDSDLQIGILKTIEFYNKLKKRVKREISYTTQCIKEDGVLKVNEYFENDILIKSEAFYTLEFEKSRKFNKQINFYNDNRMVIKEEYFLSKEFIKLNNIDKIIKYYEGRYQLVKTEFFRNNKLVEQR